jgi:hypothetical protein
MIEVGWSTTPILILDWKVDTFCPYIMQRLSIYNNRKRIQDFTAVVMTGSI